MEFHRFYILILIIINLCFLSTISSKKTKEENICTKEINTLNVFHEEIIADLLTNNSKIKNLPAHFEASDVVLRSDGKIIYVVFDNTFQIGAFCTSSRNCIDQILTWPDETVDKNEASQFEGITYNHIENSYYVVQEAIPTINDKKKYQPNIFEIHIERKIEIIESCRVDLEFESDNKGFEGLQFIVHKKLGKTFLMGLCEANKCASWITDKTDAGHGRVVLLEKKEATKKYPCSWNVVDKIHLPPSIQFIDYSAISLYEKDSSIFVAITSQENSQVWIGIIEELNEFPYFQILSLKNDIIYNLPRINDGSKKCLIQYCNIEGVAWQNENQLIFVSDKCKKDQDEICHKKDQSIHYVSFVN